MSAARSRLSDFRLRAKLVVYLVLVHAALAGLAVYAFRDALYWLIAVEAVLALSLAIGYRLVRALFVPLALLKTGAGLIAEGDFSTRFMSVGQPEMDELIAVYNRMSESLRAERLKGEERQLLLQRILDASPAGLVTLDFDGNVSEVSPPAARLLGVVPSDLSGRSLDSFASPLLTAVARLEPGASAVIPGHGQRRLKASRGEFLDRGFRRSFFVLSELSSELRSSEKGAFQKLIRLMSHEVNNSVGGVRSLLESVGGWEDQISPADRGEFHDALAVAIARLDALNGFMAGFAEVARMPPPDRRPCDVGRLLDDLLRTLRPELERRRIVCSWRRRQDLATVAADKNQLEHALLNILRNACEAISEDGRIELDLAEVGGRAELRIGDSGPGIAPEIRDALFTPFFSTKRDGRGLGLTVVREVFDAHGFDFGLESRDGGGAEMWVRMLHSCSAPGRE